MVSHKCSAAAAGACGSARASIVCNGKPKMSKNVVSERKRRQKMNRLLYTLRALVPNISKMDKASILGDAIDYVNELKQKVERAQSDMQSCSSFTCDETQFPAIRLDSSSRYPSSDLKHHLQVEMKMVEEGTVDVRMRCTKDCGVLFKLARAVDSIPMTVRNINVTSLGECVLLNLILQVSEGGDAVLHVRRSLEEMFGIQGLIFMSD